MEKEAQAAQADPGILEGASTEEVPQDEALLAEEESGESALTELLGFMLSNEEYSLDILEIKEIIRLQDITAVPRTPVYLRGIITLRGVIIPIFDLRTRMGLGETEDSGSTRIIVVYRGEEYAGLIVDAITQVMRIRPEKIEPSPTTIGVSEAEYIKGVTRHEERLVILLNLPRVLDVAT